MASLGRTPLPEFKRFLKTAKVFIEITKTQGSLRADKDYPAGMGRREPLFSKIPINYHPALMKTHLAATATTRSPFTDQTSMPAGICPPKNVAAAGKVPRPPSVTREGAGAKTGIRTRPGIGRLLTGAAALLGAAGQFSPVHARAPAEQTDSPCDALRGLQIHVPENYQGLPESSVPSMLPAVPFDASIHGNAHDALCALIQQNDQKHEPATYRLIPKELMVFNGVKANGFYVISQDAIAFSSSPVVTPGEKESLRDAIRHESRHRDVMRRNLKKTADGRYDYIHNAGINPCALKKDRDPCQANILKTRKIFGHISATSATNSGKAEVGRIMGKLYEASTLLTSDRLVLNLTESELRNAGSLFKGKVIEEPFRESPGQAFCLELPRDPFARFQDFLAHIGIEAQPRFDGYERQAQALDHKGVANFLAAEFDATLVGLYGLKAAQAIIAAASYVPDETGSSEL